ncbi:MAG: CarD family transcriptional regulator [Methylocystaceae bacterium]
MFKVSDYVVHGSNGVCQIVNIKKDEYSTDVETEYYFLKPVFGDNMTIMVPVNNPKTAMRAISTKDDILSLIASMSAIETTWIQDEKQRNEDFKAALRSGNNEELIKIIKTLYLEKEARSAAGRKLTKTDEEIFNSAEKHINQEFAIVLDISPDEVIPYILEHIS